MDLASGVVRKSGCSHHVVSEKEAMAESEKNRLARIVEERWVDFQTALTDNKHNYPIREFQTFARSLRQYIESTEHDSLIHRKVANAFNELKEHLELERKRIPGTVLHEADRLECLLFSGYDPYFQGDEPPGL